MEDHLDLGRLVGIGIEGGELVGEQKEDYQEEASIHLSRGVEGHEEGSSWG